jgi:hypothetical protein
LVEHSNRIDFEVETVALLDGEICDIWDTQEIIMVHWAMAVSLRFNQAMDVQFYFEAGIVAMAHEALKTFVGKGTPRHS